MLEVVWYPSWAKQETSDGGVVALVRLLAVYVAGLVITIGHDAADQRQDGHRGARFFNLAGLPLPL